MTDKLTPKSMKDQYDHQWNVFCKKNHDYGNSFEKSLDTFGLVAGIVRMNDKFERLLSLTGGDKDAQIASESLVDTLEDLSNYAAMAACWLKRKHEQNWAKERITAIKKEGVPVCKELEDAILKSVDDKIKSADIYSRDIPSGKIIGIQLVGRGNGKSASVQQVIKEALDKPKFDGIRLFGPEKLELNLEVDQDKLFEISNALLSKEEAKKENDRVMLDMMLSRIEKGEVVRIVANGDGSFTTYFEKTDGPFDKIVDKEDESIFHEREGWEEEVFRTTADVKIDGQNGSSVTFTDGNGIFSFGNGVTARSLKGFTLGANPDEITKSLNEKRKDAGFDPVNGEEDDR